MIAAAKGFTDIIQLMSQNSTLDLNKTDRNGVNAFWIAAWFSRIKVMRQLLAMGVDSHAANQNGSNALHIAVKLGHANVVREIMNLKNLSVDGMKKNGVTALGIAAFRGNVPMMDLLSK